jgi:hypothetical protein
VAIQKEKTLSNGAVGNYWRITSIFIDRQTMRVIGTIALFKDAAASAAGKPPLGEFKKFNFTFTMAEFLAAANAVAFVYTKIVAYAQQIRTHDINGVALETPVYFDADLADGITVL